MIINAQQSNVKIHGDIKEFKTSIDPKNLEFITTLLSSNLYSDPEQSFIREIVSNAWDSHVEAGTTDQPVIINILDKNNTTCEVSIRDYGTGISPERFQEIYINIGSSTKRESNSYIGGFGIGKFSALACSNTVYITSYYNGIAYHYIMIKDGNTITTNLVSTLPTAEKNGVKVAIYVPTYSKSKYHKALKSIIFFPNVYVNVSDKIYDISVNKSVIKKFNNFSVVNVAIDDYHILLGNVLYPCNKSLLSKEASDFIRSLWYTGIALTFNIGDLSITPNRESIIYTSDTVAKIEEKIKEAKKELIGILKSKLKDNVTDLKVYYKYITDSLLYDLIKDEVSNKSGSTPGNYRFNDIMSLMSIKYKGEELSENVNRNIRSLFSSNIPFLRAYVTADRIYCNKAPKSYYYELQLRNIKSVLKLKGVSRLDACLKSYLRENYKNTVIIKEANIEDYNNEYKFTNDSEKTLQIIKDYIDELTTELDIEKDEKFIQYRNAYKESIKSVKKSSTLKDTKNVVLQEVKNCYVIRKFSYSNLEKVINYLSSFRQGIVLCEASEDINIISQIADIYNYKVFKIRKAALKQIKELDLSFIIDSEWLMYKDPRLSEIATLFKYNPVFPDYLKYFISKEEFRYLCKVKDIQNRVNRYSLESWCRELLKRNIIQINTYLDNLLLKVKRITEEYLDKYAEAKNLTLDTLTTFLLLKDKKMRPSKELYEVIKNNKTLNKLCRK